MAILLDCRRFDLERYTLRSVEAIVVAVGEQHELFLKSVDSAEDECEELLPLVTNKVGRLLLPLEIPASFMEILNLQLRTRMLLIYDDWGRVHQIVMDSCLFLTLMRCWAPPELTQCQVVIEGILEDQVVTHDKEVGVRLLLPPHRPPDFGAWQPSGEYQVSYDKKGRLFTVLRFPDTNINLGELWEPRF
jgi:hypothetical protein